MTLRLETAGLSSAYNRLAPSRKHAIACAVIGMTEAGEGRTAAANALAEGSCITKARVLGGKLIKLLGMWRLH